MFGKASLPTALLALVGIAVVVTSLAVTAHAEDPSGHWKVSTFNAANLDPSVPGNHAAWCGETYSYTCGDTPQGYGNDWNDPLYFVYQVPDPSLPAQIDVGAVLNHDVEPGSDFVRLVYYKSGQADPRVAYEFNGTAMGVALSSTILYDPADYLGPAGDIIRIAIVVTTDPSWSDVDCLWPTDGAVQIDNISVDVTQDGVVDSFFDDFEGDDLGNWAAIGAGTGLLSDGGHTPDECRVDDPVTYSVFWASPANLPADQAMVRVITEAQNTYTYEMSTSAELFQDGALYTYTGPAREVGTHSYYFYFVDQNGSNVLLRAPGGGDFVGPTVTERVNELPIILNMSYSPSLAPSGSEFRFDVGYYDAEGECATFAAVYLRNPITGVESFYPLTNLAPDCSGATVYSTSVVLHDVGVYQSRFAFLNTANQYVLAPVGPPGYNEDPVVTEATASDAVPSATRLGAAHPNPFNPSTTISFALRDGGRADVSVFDLAGRKIRTLLSEHLDAGRHEARWNGRDESGRRVASGVYLYRLVAGGFSETRRMVLLK